jgi:phytoene dehydrogenase-like protein
MSHNKALCFMLLCFAGCAFSFTYSGHHHSQSFRSIGAPSTQVRASRQNFFSFFRRKTETKSDKGQAEDADIVVVGGGVSGLTAAITAAEIAKEKKNELKIVLVEGSSELGGRVQSEVTEDGFVLDKGFAVFIDQYPEAKKLLDFEALKLKPFLPGALVKLKSRNKLARVSDPLRQPEETVSTLTVPIGSFRDKLNLIPLILNVRTKSIEELFEERETDTASALSSRWGFSEDFVAKFFKPFLEGIYLAPLSEQSSRMFSFVFKMFNEGSANLPEGGMIAVTEQLVKRAHAAGVDIRTDMPVAIIGTETDDDCFVIECSHLKQKLRARSVVVATDGQMAQKLLSNMEGFQSLLDLPEQPQRSVGCLYYTFKGPPPVEEPILILNGISEEFEKTPPSNLVNNVCFPSVVNKGYAPDGFNLCSVTILGKNMEAYEGRHSELDSAVRQELASWFQNPIDILENWTLKKIFHVSIELLHPHCA